MKKVICTVMLLLGMSIIFRSCEKGSTELYIKKLEGRWWCFQKVEICFNGKIIKTSADPEAANELGYDRIYIESGAITLDWNGDKETYACSVIGSEITVWDYTYDIVKVTNKEAVIDAFVSKCGFSVDKDDLENAKLYGKYEGKDIYYNSKYNDYWYFDERGKPISCYYKENVWENGTRYWYDKERYYFKAE